MNTHGSTFHPPLVGQTTGTVFRLYGADQLPDTFSDL